MGFSALLQSPFLLLAQTGSPDKKPSPDPGKLSEAIRWDQFFSAEMLTNLFQALIIAVLGLIVVRMIVLIVRRSLKDRLHPQLLMLVSKVLTYGGVFIIVMMILAELDFKITTLLGAAGVVGIALGFAAQTAVSNLISGVFLIFERPFQVGDLITVSDKTGFVLSIDLLSVKLRQFDNRFVRIPNEIILKEQVINITHFPIRRVDILVGVAYKESLKDVKDILLQIADEHPKALADPEPVIVFQGFGSSSQDILLGVWVENADFLVVRNDLTVRIKEVFDEKGIEIPFPHVTFYTGEVTKPLPLTIQDRSGDQAPSS